MAIVYNPGIYGTSPFGAMPFGGALALLVATTDTSLVFNKELTELVFPNHVSVLAIKSFNNTLVASKSVSTLVDQG